MPEASRDAGEEEGLLHSVPTAQDRENARIRQAISDRQQAAYDQCLQWARAAFGEGWRPSHRHYLVEKEAEEHSRRTGERPVAAATVYTVRDAAGDKRHFTVEDGVVTPQQSYEEGFGAMLLEPHPTRGFMHRGEFCRTHRYSLCFAPFELYSPKSADALAALRVSRQQKKAAREDARFAEEYPLLARAGITRHDG